MMEGIVLVVVVEAREDAVLFDTPATHPIFFDDKPSQRR